MLVCFLPAAKISLADCLRGKGAAFLLSAGKRDGEEMAWQDEALHCRVCGREKYIE